MSSKTSKSEAARLKAEAIANIGRVLELQRSGRWTLADIEWAGAYLWSLCRDDAGLLMPGEVVCRHVAAYLASALDRAGIPCRVDTWSMERVPGSPYNGHATICVRPRLASGALSDSWYYVDWARMVGPGLDNFEAASRRVRPGAEGTDYEGLPLTRDGVPDHQWMANHRYGRALTGWLSKASDRTLRGWVLEWLRQRKYIIQELRTDEALELTGDARTQRLVLA